ncbi:hypothetical protein RhiLY_11008 [Ceratobasidium sp. AG-Ba]|nr:hypothetical protein RhiLY_11008 [Ceratobasidium sp. AG-Ba]
MLTSAFAVPSGTGAVLIPSPSTTVTSISDNRLHGGALAGAIIGGILGVVGLLGIGAFLLRSLGGAKQASAFWTGGVFGDAPGSSSWAPYAYAGAAAAGAATSNQQNRRGRDSGGNNANARYGDGGIRDEETPDGQARYGDGGLAGPDSQYDRSANASSPGAYRLHSGDVTFEPYRDLPLDEDQVTGVGRQDGENSGTASRLANVNGSGVPGSSINTTGAINSGGVSGPTNFGGPGDIAAPSGPATSQPGASTGTTGFNNLGGSTGAPQTTTTVTGTPGGHDPFTDPFSGSSPVQPNIGDGSDSIGTSRQAGDTPIQQQPVRVPYWMTIHHLRLDTFPTVSTTPSQLVMGRLGLPHSLTQIHIRVV